MLGQNAMTKLLQKAFDEAAKLSESAQDQLAAQLLRDLADEVKWDETLAASADQLEQLAAQALKEYQEGWTEELGFDDL